MRPVGKQYANLIFLVAALAFAIIGLLETQNVCRYLAPLLVIVALLSSSRCYFDKYVDCPER
jgi:hypothetical protein